LIFLLNERLLLKWVGLHPSADEYWLNVFSWKACNKMIEPVIKRTILVKMSTINL